jgi:hypothetical protein
MTSGGLLTVDVIGSSLGHNDKGANTREVRRSETMTRMTAVLWDPGRIITIHDTGESHP